VKTDLEQQTLAALRSRVSELEDALALTLWFLGPIKVTQEAAEQVPAELEVEISLTDQQWTARAVEVPPVPAFSTPQDIITGH
jgi:hypothetical protein